MKKMYVLGVAILLILIALVVIYVPIGTYDDCHGGDFCETVNMSFGDMILGKRQGGMYNYGSPLDFGLPQ